MTLNRSYHFIIDHRFVNYDWTDDEKRVLRPIAETIALLDGNAYFPHKLPDGREWYEQYLPEAASIFYDNGGLDGWAQHLSWIEESIHENDNVKNAYDSWQVIKKLSKSK